MISTPRSIRVNVYNLPFGIIQTTYYAHSAEVLGDTLVVDIAVDSPTYVTSQVPMTMSHPATAKFDLAPIRRYINVKTVPLHQEETELEHTENEAELPELFMPIATDVSERKVSEIVADNVPDTQHEIVIASPSVEDTVSTIHESSDEYETIEVTSVRTGKKHRYQGNRDAHWISKKRKTRKDKGTIKGVECPLCMKGRMILHRCCRCNNSFCLDCFDKLMKHQYDMNVCIVCKQNF